jgi:hypothetical protein
MEVDGQKSALREIGIYFWRSKLSMYLRTQSGAQALKVPFAL